ncbi:MAG: hypothetical protein ACOCWQ_00790 [Nanoarchaeota archaeon]
MATFLDIGLLSGASTVFTLIMIWAIIYGILLYTKWLGEEKHNLYAIIAFAIAVLTISTRSIVQVFSTVIPWFVFAIFVGVFIILALMTVGYDKDMIAKTLKGKEWSSTIAIWTIVIAIIITIAGLGSVFFSGDGIAQEETNVTVSATDGTVTTGDVGETGRGALWATIFHPKVLGFIIVMLISFVVVQQVGKGAIS